jgi:hypothetical protein
MPTTLSYPHHVVTDGPITGTKGSGLDCRLRHNSDCTGHVM